MKRSSSPYPLISLRTDRLRLGEEGQPASAWTGRTRAVMLAARRADLLPNCLSQYVIDPVLPARSGFLEVIKNLPVDSQCDKLLGVRDSRTLRREFRGLRCCRLERRFGCIPRGSGSSCSVVRHSPASLAIYSGSFSCELDLVKDRWIVVVHPRRDWPHAHGLRGKRSHLIARVLFLTEPS